MIKTLRITSVAVAALAVLLLVLPVVFGSYTESQVEEFLNSPSAVEQFRADKGSKTPRGKDQVPPLVKQAQAFALYLNPPPKPKPKPKPAQKTKSTMAREKLPPKPKSVIKPKFKLIATSFHASRPELSMALIDQPGEGYRWVRQSAKVGHLVIEEVKDGLVVIRDKNRLEELSVTARPQTRSLIKGASVSQAPATTTSLVSKPQIAPKSVPKPDFSGEKRQIQPISAEQREYMEEMAKTIKALRQTEGATLANPNMTTDKKALLQKLMLDLQTIRVGSEEAEKLGRLGKTLDKIQRDPNKVSDRRMQIARRRRGRLRTRPPEPNKPAEK